MHITDAHYPLCAFTGADCTYYVPLRSYNLSNIANIRRMLYNDNLTNDVNYQRITDAKGMDELVNDLYQSGKRVVFTMGKGGVGKGGVGKTTLATEIALKLTKLGANHSQKSYK